MTEEEKRQRLVSLGFDPNTFEYEDENITRTPTVKPLAESLNTSAAGAFSRSLARGALPSLAAGATAFGIGSLLDVTGVGAPIGIPLQLVGAGLAGFGTRRLQDVVAPNIIPGYIESEQQDISERPIASAAGNIASTIAGGLSPSISNIPRAARTIRALTTGVKPAQSEIQNLLNVGLGATIPPAQQTAISLAQGQGVPSLQDLLLSSAGGALFSQPNIIGRQLFGWQPNLPSSQQFSAEEAAKTQLRGRGTPLGVLVKPLEDISAEAQNIRATQEKQQAQLDELTELASETGKFPGKKPGPAQVIPGFEGFEAQFKAAMDKKIAERKLQAKIDKAEIKSQLEAEQIAKEVKLPIKEETAKLGEFPATKVPQPEPASIIPTKEALLTLPKGEEFEPQTIVPAGKTPIKEADITAPEELLRMQQEGKPLTANQLRIMRESLQRSLTEGQIPSETKLPTLQQSSPEITKEAQLKGYTTTPTLGWHNIFQKLGLVRGTKITTQGLILDPVTGKSISGEAYLRTGINQALAKINTSKAGLDTWPHELFHIFYHDLLASDKVQDNKVAQAGDLAARSSKEYLTAKANDPSLTPHEFLTKKVGADVVRRVFKTDGSGKLANWFKDFWSYIKTRWAPNKASAEDYTRLFSNRLLFDRPFRDTIIDTNKQIAGERLQRGLQAQEPEILNTEQKNLISNFHDAATKVSERTTYGLRKEIPNKSSYILVWSNAQNQWYVSRGIAPKGVEVQLDANHILINAKNRKYAELIAQHLPELPLAKFAAERNPLLNEPEKTTAQEKLQFLRDFGNLDVTKPDVINATSKFMDKIISPEQTNKPLLQQEESEIPSEMKEPEGFPKPKEFEELTLTENLLYNLVHERNGIEAKMESHMRVQFQAYADFKAGKITREEFDAIRIPNENSLNKYLKIGDQIDRQINQLRPDINKSLQQESEPEITPSQRPERTPAEMLEGPVAPVKEGEKVSGLTKFKSPSTKLPLSSREEPIMTFRDRSKNIINYKAWLQDVKKLSPEEAQKETNRFFSQQFPEISPLKPLTQKDAENVSKAQEANILPNTIPEQRIEREWHLGKLRPEIEKIKQQGESGRIVGDSMDNFYENYRENIGKYITTPVRELKDVLGINVKSSLQSYLTQDSTAAQHVRDYLWDIEDKGKSNIQLTSQEQEGVNIIQAYLKSVRDEQNSRPALRKGGYNPYYIPFIADRDVINSVINKPNSERAQSLIKEFIQYQIEKGKTREEALDQLKTFRAGYAKEQPNIAKQFGPIDKAAGVGIPRSWREKNLIDTLARYGNRVARRFAYHDNMEANPAFEDALINPNTGVAGNESVKAVMRDIAGIRPTAELARTAALGLIKAGIFGPLTGVRNFAQNFTIGLEHSGSPALATKAFIDSWQNMKQNLADSFASGVNRENISSLEFGDEGNTNVISLLRRVRDIASDIQGRNILERITRATTYGQGKFLAMHYLEEANQRGNFSKDGAQFFKNFGQGIDITPSKESFTPDELSKIASRLTENIQGKYDYRGLPQIAVEGTLAPFLALSRWSIERSNNFMKYVVSPALNGNYKPFLLSTLGMVLGGEVVNAITQFATGKKERTASFKELTEAPAEGKNIAIDALYKMAALSSVSGYAGILGDLAKLAGDKIYGKVKPQSYNNALVEFASNTAETGADFIDALREGELDTNSMIELVNKLLSDHIQTYRVLLAHLGPETKENIDRINKLRDLRTFNTLGGDRITDLSEIAQDNPLRNIEAKRFKKEQDIGKAVEMLPSLIQDAIERSKGNPERLRQELRSLKENQYSTLPNPKTLPFSFLNYIKFLQNTQGNEEASKRLSDYLIRNTINREKSQLVPSI